MPEPAVTSADRAIAFARFGRRVAQGEGDPPAMAASVMLAHESVLRRAEAPSNGVFDYSRQGRFP